MVAIETGKYSNGRTAIKLIDVEDGSPVLTATVNVPDAQLADDEVVLKTYSENAGIERFFIDNNLASFTGRFVMTGYMTCPVMKLTGLRA